MPDVRPITTRAPMLISQLQDHPQFIDSLALHLFEQWRHIVTEVTVESFKEKLNEHLNTFSPPIAWVAHQGPALLGTASLRVHDLHGREDLTPWLGGVFVVPSARRTGVGLALCQAVEDAARRLGYSTLYLFTLDKQLWYGNQGWRLFAPCMWRERSGDIMRKDLAKA